MKQSAKIIFRVRNEMKDFVKEFAGKMGMDTSDFMRLVLEYYYFAMFTQQGSYKEIREKFFSLYPERNPKNKAKM
jgi:hypothetical protein